MAAFHSKYPFARDDLYLTDYPKSGEVRVNKAKWQFVRHGGGLRFQEVSDGSRRTIDIHKYIGEPHCFDYWRLSELADSLGIDVDQNSFAEALLAMTNEQKVVQYQSDHYLRVQV